jgi:hypothetical protein
MGPQNCQMWLLEKIAYGNEIWNDELIFKHLYKGALSNDSWPCLQRQGYYV